MKRHKNFWFDHLISLLTFLFIITSSNFSWAADQTFLASAVIAVNDHTYDGYNIIVGNGVDPVILTINGTHSFAGLVINNNAVVTHGVTDTTTVYALDLTVSGNVDIGTGGRIDVIGRGYPGGYQGGNNSNIGRSRGNQTANGSGGGSGGSHGGYGGGGANGSPGIAYDDLSDPKESGAGGGAYSSGHVGGNGGGLIRMTISGTLTNNGVITANGASVNQNMVSGGGAGGGIRLNVGTLAGTGNISANGGTGGFQGGYGEGGGSGGRIAVYYDTTSFSGVISAYGATGNNGGGNAGAGTIFKKQTAQTYGDLEVNNNIVTSDISTPTPFEIWRGASDVSGGITATILTDSTANWAPGTLTGLILNPNRNQNATFLITGNTTTTIIVSGDMTQAASAGDLYAIARSQFDTITLSGDSFVGFDDFPMAASNWHITDTAVLTHVNTGTVMPPQLVLNMNNLTIDGTAGINVTGRGYLGAHQGGNSSNIGRSRGNQTANGSSGGSGGSHGGYGGGGSGGPYGIAYDDLSDPKEPGAGGGAWSSGHVGGNGGGLIRITVSGTLTINGAITANGASVNQNMVSGGGAGGGIRLDVGTLAGNGSITANGGTGGFQGGYGEGGGGGGRIAVYYGTDSFAGTITAYGATGNNGGINGGAGTIFKKQTAQTYGDVEVNNNIGSSDISTPTPFEVWRGASDVSGGITSTILTDSTASWTPGAFAGFVLNPNLNRNITFSIISNTATTITVSGDMSAAAVDGDAYAVVRSRFDNITFAGNSFVGIDDFGLTASALNISDNAVLTHFNATPNSAPLLILDLTDLTIAPTAKIDVNGRGYLGAYQGGNSSNIGRSRGNQAVNGSSGGSGGSHGGYGGGGSGGPHGIAYDDLSDPKEPGAGGGAWSSGHAGGNGGGLIRLTVTGTLTNNGVITANGISVNQNMVSGGGAGGGIRLDVGTLAGNGAITANGGSGGFQGGYGEGGGAGGRIAVYYGTDSFVGTITAYGATGNNGGINGGAGTIFKKQTAQTYGDVEVNNNLSTSNISTPTPFEVWRGVSNASGGITATVLTDSTASWTPGAFTGFVLNPNLNQNVTFSITGNTATTVTISGDMTAVAGDGDAYAVARPRLGTITLSGASYVGFDDFVLTADVLNIVDTAVLTHFNAVTNSAPGLNLDLIDLNIDSTARIDVDSRGYLGAFQGGNSSNIGRGRGNQAANGSSGGSGGSHGGYGGGGSGGPHGIAYDDLSDPKEPGAGGGAWSSGHAGGNGGGLIRMKVTGTLTNNGVITANGASVNQNMVSGGGSGGGIRLDVGTLAGNGAITVNGGSGGFQGGYGEGGGAGGRIAIYFETDSFGGTITTYGGAGFNGGANGGAGTIFRKQSAQTYGDVEIKNSLTTPEISTPTFFEVWRGVSDASGGITATVLTDSTASWTPGAFTGFLLNPNLNQNVTFSITGNTATTITVSGDMSAAAVDGNPYAVARRQFDNVNISGMSYVGLDDFVLTVADLNITDTAVLTHANADTVQVPHLDLALTNLTVSALAKIDVNSRGYLGANQGGNNSVYGRTSGNVTTNGSSGGAGGSYGGRGGNGAGGVIGLTYGDPLNPQEPGAGGGAWSSGHAGGDGGGLIRIVVYGQLQNDGMITANGASVNANTISGGGSGGGIRLDVGTLAGNGNITAIGGDGGTQGGYAEGGGGGGRIAIYYTEQNNFSGQILYDGGNGYNGGENGQVGTLNMENTAPVVSIISGTVTMDGSGLPGVAMTGLPGTPVTDSNGAYTSSVAQGWTGTVVPVLSGYGFNPVNRDYTGVSTDQTEQNYTGTLNTYIISGTITYSGLGLPGVTLNGLPGTPVTDISGFYSATVTYGWYGTVTPAKTGYSFNPVSIAYTKVTGNQILQDYTATLDTYIISGRVTESGAGLPGVVMTGLPGSPVTDTGGYYSTKVDYNWSGTVTPAKTGYTFTPPSKIYGSVTTDQTGQDYTATLITFTISGTVSEGSFGLPGVAMTGLPGTPLTDASGFYTAAVPQGFTGTVVPALIGFAFNPVSLDYTNVSSNQTGQDYSAALQSGDYYVDVSYPGTGRGTSDQPWQTLHTAIRHINNGAAGSYILHVASGIYQVSPLGLEPDEVLGVTQDSVTIIGQGCAGTIIDGIGAASWKDGFDIQSVTNGLLQNLEIRNFSGNGIALSGAVNCMIEACCAHDNHNNGVVIQQGATSNPASGNAIKNGCQVYNNSNSGIYINDSANNQIIDDTGSIYDNGNVDSNGAGIWMTGSNAANNLIENCRIYYSGNANHVQGTGIKVVGSGADNVIEGNEIYGHGDAAAATGAGIEVDGSDILISRNMLYDNMSGIGVLDSAGHAAPDIVNNLIYNGPANNTLWGIWVAPVNGGTGASPVIYHNTINGGGNDGIYLNRNTGSGPLQPVIKFNIVSNFSHWGISDINGNSNPQIDFNDVWNNGSDPANDNYVNCLPGANDVSVTPDFIAQSNFDFHLQTFPPSACIDAIPTSISPPDPVTEDLDGISRPQGPGYDMGCYETTAPRYTVNFNAGSGGSLSGNVSQTVVYGRSCTPVTAMPNAGYSFTGWGDSAGNTWNANPLTITNVTSNMTITANFLLNKFTLTFIPATGGTISGNTIQIVSYGGSAASVTAVPDTGYEFIGWSGGYSGTDNPLAITNVTANMTIYANFKQKGTATHTVAFSAGIGGSLTGNPTQTVVDGGSCTSVTAVPDTGYEFNGWSGGYTSMNNPLTITNVTVNISITANFKKKTYSVSAAPGTGGKITGTPAEPVPYGNTVILTAVPDEGYEFTGWSGDYTGTENPLTITNITSNVNIAAQFSLKNYFINFTAGAGGKVSGNASQTVPHDASASPVTAVPDAGYEFTGWSGDYTGTTNPLTLSSVASNMTVAANFKKNAGNLPPAAPVLVTPGDNAVIPPGAVELETGPYLDPENDPHTRTWWQVRVYGDPKPFIDEKSDTELTSYLASAGFEPGLQYEWRAAYQDAGSGEYSPWSDWGTFVVGQIKVDENIPPVEPGIGLKDYKMVSFIQWPANPSADAVFGPMMGEGYNDKDFRIGTYDPMLGQGGYHEYPGFTVEPGRAYWFLSRQGLDLTIEGVPVSTSVDFCMELKFNTGTGNGWNMISPPNNANYRWGDLQVTAKDIFGKTVFGPIPISQLASDNPYIDIRIWEWTAGSYTLSSDANFMMQRYAGYWVRAKQANVYLCFPPAAQIAQISSVIRIASWMKDLKNRVSEKICGLSAAYAGISTDSPPMPMGRLNEGSGGGGSGCFISTVFDENEK